MEGTCVVIVNPAAGGGRARRQWPAISRRLTEAGCAHTAILTRQPGEAIELCRTVLRDRARLVVAAGGDGTLNEVANGFFSATGDNSILHADACLGVLPLGTGSDFARALGITRPEAGIPPLVAAETALLDVGRVDFQDQRELLASRYFMNVADLGLGAASAERVNRSPKVLGGLVSYLISAIRAIMAYRPQEVAVRLDGSEPIRGPMGIVVVANSRYFGGGMLVAPGAKPDDGLFDVLCLTGAGRTQMLTDLLPKVYRGAHIPHPAVRLERATSVTVKSHERFPLAMDGEPIGTGPATFTMLPRALRFVVPQGWKR